MNHQETRDLATITEQPPPCHDVTGVQDPEKLYEAWDLQPEEPDEVGHAWAQPWELAGNGVIEPAVCLRCGALRTMNLEATDPATGRRVIWISYETGVFADEVQEVAARA